jgi:hypothetical protein
MVNKKGKYYYPVFQIGVKCSKELENRVKRFCSIQNITLSNFAATALENEVNFQIDSMPEKERELLQILMNKQNIQN